MGGGIGPVRLIHHGLGVVPAPLRGASELSPVICLLQTDLFPCRGSGMSQHLLRTGLGDTLGGEGSYPPLSPEISPGQSHPPRPGEVLCF